MHFKDKTKLTCWLISNVPVIVMFLLLLSSQDYTTLMRKKWIKEHWEKNRDSVAASLCMECVWSVHKVHRQFDHFPTSKHTLPAIRQIVRGPGDHWRQSMNKINQAKKYHYFVLARKGNDMHLKNISRDFESDEPKRCRLFYTTDASSILVDKCEWLTADLYNPIDFTYKRTLHCNLAKEAAGSPEMI